MEALKENVHTIDTIYSLPDKERAELIDGKIYYMAPPTRTHQQILLAISRKIADYIDTNNGLCEVNIAPFAVFLDDNGINYVEPDICVICDSSKLDDKGCHGAPDWIIEIVSESSRRMDYMIKLFKYRSAGIREYWIIDPKKQRTIVYNFEHDMMDEYSFNDKIPVGIYDKFFIQISKEK